jgi:hypothetical protein
MSARTKIGLLCATTLGLSLTGLVGAGARPAMAAEHAALPGPPAICFPIECDGTSIPWDEADDGRLGRYKATQAIADSLRVLQDSKDPLVHMETIRRATIYLNNDAGHGNELMARLLARAGDAEAAKAADADRELAWLDAGYFAGAAAQLGIDFGWKPGEGKGDPAVHFAAAIICHPAMNRSKTSEYQSHMRAAYAAAPRDSMLRRNIDAQIKAWGELTGID